MTLCTSSGNIHVAWDDEQLNGPLRNLFTPWQGPNGVPPVFTVTIGSNRDGYTVQTPRGDFSCPGLEHLFPCLEYHLTVLFQDLFHRNLLIHAAGIEHRGNAALLVGNHGSGKTTLALTAIMSGMRALTDDMAIISEDRTELLGFPRPFKVTGDTWKMEPRVIPADSPGIRCANDTTYVSFYQPDSRHYAGRARLRAIFFPMRHSGLTRISPLGETEALRRLLPQGFNFSDRGDTLVGELLDLLKNAPPYELRYRFHWNAIGKVKAML